MIFGHTQTILKSYQMKQPSVPKKQLMANWITSRVFIEPLFDVKESFKIIEGSSNALKSKAINEIYMPNIKLLCLPTIILHTTLNAVRFLEI